jgi:hypothetical protein
MWNGKRKSKTNEKGYKSNITLFSRLEIRHGYSIRCKASLLHRDRFLFPFNLRYHLHGRETKRLHSDAFTSHRNDFPLDSLIRI